MLVDRQGCFIQEVSNQGEGGLSAKVNSPPDNQRARASKGRLGVRGQREAAACTTARSALMVILRLATSGLSSVILVVLSPVNQASLVAQVAKNLPAMLETWVRSPGSGRSPGEQNGNPLQYSCLENPMDREAWRAAVHGVTKSRTRLSN